MREREIVPSRMFKIQIFDNRGNYKRTIMKIYPSEGIEYYDTVAEARKELNWRKHHRPFEFEEDDIPKIVMVNVDEEVMPNYYTKPHGGRRYKFTKEQREEIRREQEKSDSYGPPYKWFPPLSDEEIEGRNEYEIFHRAARNKDGTVNVAKGLQALQEYNEGIRDRKKKSARTKTKRKSTKPAKRVHKKIVRKVVRKKTRK